MASTAHFNEYPLSPIDRTYLSNYVRCQIFFSAENTSLGIDDLRVGIPRLIEELPFLSGNISICEVDSPKKEVLTVRPPETFALEDIFKVKEYDTSLQAALGDTQELQEERQMPQPQMVDPLQPVPILRIQANVYTDGILLTLVVAHMACDAGGIGTMIETLAACCKVQGSELEYRLTGTEREAETRMLLSRDPIIFPCDDADASFKKPYGELESYSARHRTVAPALSHRPEEPLSNYHFAVSAEKLAALKELCNQILAQPTGDTPKKANPPWVSSNDVFAALLWICVNRSRYPPLGEVGARRDSGHSVTTTLIMAVNIRHRLSPPLPETYMGNAAIGLLHPLELCEFEPHAGNDSNTEKKEKDNPTKEDTITLPACLSTACSGNGVEIAKTLCRIAHSIRTSLNGITPKYLDDLLSYLTNCPKYPTLVGAPGAFPVSSWRDLKLYDTDFGPGLGRPVHMRRFDAPAEGTVYVLPQRGQGVKVPWEFQITLREATLQQLSMDPLWCAFVDKDNFWG